MCQKWFAKFCGRHFLLVDALLLGRPVESDRDEIKTLIENNQHSTMQEIANILKISKINKVISENEKRVFYFTENTKWTF